MVMKREPSTTPPTKERQMIYPNMGESLRGGGHLRKALGDGLPEGGQGLYLRRVVM